MTTLVVPPNAESSRASKAPASRRVTLRDVAERAGVQEACVSVVINGAKSNAHVSATARERVIAAAEELGYKRNGTMSALAKGRFGCVALLLSTKPAVSVLPSQVWEGICDELARQNLHLSLFRLPDEELTDIKRLPKILREWMADGMLIDYTHNIPSDLKAVIDNYALPAIWINSKQEYDCVRPDDVGAGVAATNYLLGLGHRRIAYVHLDWVPKEDLEHYSVLDRYEGYLQAMNAVGATPQSFFAREVPREEHALLIESFLQDSQERPTAIITYDSAQSVLWATAHMGLEVPRDLSLINLSADLVCCGGTRVTAYAVPEHEIGRCASVMIQEKIAAPHFQQPSQVLPFTLFEGNSTAPVIT